MSRVTASISRSAASCPTSRGASLRRVDGRLHTDYWRFSQVGWTNGAALIDGKQYEVNRWFSWRDHSWGVRPGVGGFEPFTGTKAGAGLPSSIRAAGLGILVIYLGFATDNYGESSSSRRTKMASGSISTEVSAPQTAG